MNEWLAQLTEHLTWTRMAMGFVIFLVSFSGSLALVSFVLVKLPSNYFHYEHPREFWADRHQAVRWSGIVLKNVVGFALVALGVVMSLPGVPGQGLLTILLGIMLLDFPGKRELERKIIGRPQILNAVNRLRARFDKPPLALD